MPNRTTAKTAVTTKIVPQVTNAIHIDLLNNDILDNVKFLEDVAVTQVSTVSSISVDFTNRDRIDLTRTGGSLSITVTGLNDGNEKQLLITKTAGQAVTFVGVTDVTPVAADVTAASTILYDIVRKGSNYYARAWVGIGAATTDRAGVLETATAAESNGLFLTDKIVTPGTIPKATTTQMGIAEIASSAEIDAGTDNDISGDQLVVQPSELIRKLGELEDDIKAAATWTAITPGTGWSGTLYYHVTSYGVVHLHGRSIQRTGADVTGVSGVTLAAMPTAIRPTTHSSDINFVGRCSHVATDSDPVLLQLNDATNNIIIFPEPVDIGNGDFVSFYISYIL